MDMKSINANVNRLLSNIWAIITFLKEFTVADAKDVSITYINEDGSESAKTFPNIEKMNENAVYLSSYNSQKSRDISKWDELAVIAKSSSIGGLFRVKAQSDLVLSESLFFSGGSCIDLNGNTLSFKKKSDTTGAYSIGTHIYGNAVLYMNNGKIIVANNLSSDGDSYYTPFRSWIGHLRIVLSDMEIELNTGYLVTQHSTGVSELHLKGCVIKKGTNFQNGGLVRASGRQLIVYQKNVTLEDGLTWSDIVDDINLIEFR